MTNITQFLADTRELHRVDSCHKTPIVYACESNAPEALFLLLQLYNKWKMMTYIHVKDVFGKTALMYASMNGNVNCVRILLQYNAYENVIDDVDGLTALGFAARGGHVDIVNILLAAGVDMEDPRKRYCQPRNELRGLYAIEVAKPNVIRYLIEASPDVCCFDGRSRLMLAIEAKCSWSIDRLLNVHKVNVNISDCYGNTACIVACKWNDVKTLQSLVDDHGAYVSDDVTQQAIVSNSLECFEYLFYHSSKLIVNFKKLLRAAIVANNLIVLTLLLENVQDLLIDAEDVHKAKTCDAFNILIKYATFDTLNVLFTE
jgi:ankyrin repeat protein